MHPRIPRARVWHSCQQTMCKLLAATYMLERLRSIVLCHIIQILIHIDQCNSSPCIASSLAEVMKCIQEYHRHVCGTLVSKQYATYQMQTICWSCYNPLCCVTFATINVWSRGLNPVAVTKPLISRVGLPNLSTFLPWEDNFNSGRS